MDRRESPWVDSGRTLKGQMMKDSKRPSGWVFEPHPRDDDAWLVAVVEFWKTVCRVVGRVFVYAALAAGFILFWSMVVRCVPATYRYLAASPAPRSPAPQAIANSQRTVDEADRAPTGQVR